MVTAEWSAAWWQWAAALAPPGDPFTDTSGEFAHTNQSGPVFFLAGDTGGFGFNSRSFEVPDGAYILMPLLVGEWSQLELGFDKTAAQIRQAAQEQANSIDYLHATLDGTTISQPTLFTHREVSPDFNFVAVANNQVGIQGAGNSGIAVADGYFLMLAPLGRGTHYLIYGGGTTSGVFISEFDAITVVGPPPTITAQPIDQAVFTGSNATFSVSATTTNPPLSFQWQFNGTDISDATSSTLIVSNAQAANMGEYQVLVADSAGSIHSAVARLDLIDLPPSIVSQPTGSVIPAGSNGTFSVIAEGAAPLFYQWRFNQAAIAGATNATFLITNMQPAAIGGYDLVLTNNYGTVTSDVARLLIMAWSHTYNGSSNEGDSGLAVAVDGDGNVAVTGFSQGDYYTAKYAAASGALLWEKRYNGSANGEDSPASIAVDGGGNVVVTGHSYNQTNLDFYTAKYAAANGALLWEKRYNGAANGADRPLAMALDASGNAIVTGMSANGGGDLDNDFHTIKYAASNGSVLWEKRYNGPANTHDEVRAIAVDHNGDVVVTGYSLGTNMHHYTAKYAATNGTLLWEKRGAGNYAEKVVVDSEGDVAVTGGSDADYYTVKYASATGALIWEKRYTSTISDQSTAIALDQHDNVVVTGYSHDPVFGSRSYTVAYGASDGRVLWDFLQTDDLIFGLAVDAHDNAIVTGRRGDDFLTLKVQTAAPPVAVYRFTSVALTNGNVRLTWTPGPGLVLQRTTHLTPPNWQSVSGSMNTNQIEIPGTNASGFFQLAKP